MNILSTLFLLMTPLMAFAQISLWDPEEQEHKYHQKIAPDHHSLTTLVVHPGVPASIPIAIGHLNRIILPFDNPEIRTINPATTELKGHVLYVAPTDDQPVTLYITEAEEEEEAISLTLKPESRPPREVHLELQASSHGEGSRSHEGLNPMDSHEASLENLQKKDPAKTIKKVLRTIALGELPGGFRFRKPLGNEKITLPSSRYDIKTGQVLEGEGLEILIGVIKNSSKETIDIHESALKSQGKAILAAALWPRAKIAPGASSEIYVAVRPSLTAHRTQRPYLIAGRP